MAELIENLEIKWQLLLAQTVNFFILLYLLKKFLYKPMLKFLRERKDAIEDGLQKSELAEQKFKEMREIQARELAKTRQDAQKIIDSAKKAGEEARKETLENARKETEALFSKSEKDIEQMKNQKMADAERELAKLALEGMEYLTREKMSDERRAELQNEAIKHIKKFQNES